MLGAFEIHEQIWRIQINSYQVYTYMQIIKMHEEPKKQTCNAVSKSVGEQSPEKVLI